MRGAQKLNSRTTSSAKTHEEFMLLTRINSK